MMKRTKADVSELFLVLAIWLYRLWSLPTGDTKLERFLPKNQHTQRQLLNFENWITGGPQKFSKISYFQPPIHLTNE